MQVIPPELKKILDKWNIRGLVIMSLLFQTSLIFLAPLRKRTSNKFLATFLWTVYLSADWTAHYTVAQITKNQGKEPEPGDPPKNKKLLALWVPFLLLHLGGPDTITALALEDNALWRRHLFALVSKALAGVYAVVQSMENVLWPPITLLFIAGTIKYVERSLALYFASLEKFKNSILFPLADSKLMDEYVSRKRSNLPSNIISITREDQRAPKLVRPDRGLTREDQRALKLVRPGLSLTDLEIVQYSYKFFNIFKGLVYDLLFSSLQRDISRDFFKELEPDEALRIIEYELDFIYELMHTKTAILHTITGTLFRVLAFGSLLSSFVLFHRRPLKSEEFHGADVVITYTLFVVGIALDLVSLAMFLFSDWTYAVLSKLEDDLEENQRFIEPLLNWLLKFRIPRWKTHRGKGNRIQEVLTTGFLSRRWSGTIYGFNLIGFCMKTKASTIHQTRNYSEFEGSMFERVVRRIQLFFGWIKNVNRSVTSVTRQWSKKNLMFRYTVYMLDLVFFVGISEVLGVLWGHIDRIFSVKAYLDEIRFISSQPLTKNQWEFIFNEVKYQSGFAETPEVTKTLTSARGERALRELCLAESGRLMRSVENDSYDQSLLLWHVATELCFQQEENEEIENLSGESYHYREFSKITSDYMMYLLIMRPKLMSQVAGIGAIRFRDTLAEAERFFKRRQIKNLRDMKRVSDTILSVNIDYEPVLVKGNESRSVLFNASMLAKELQRLEKNNRINGDGKWRVLSKVWVELLCYAASHCKATEHVVQLSRGGELLSFVWLLMAHFGLSDQFEINKGDTRLKLLVEGE